MKEEAKNIIDKLEKKRNSKIIVYFTGDRSQIAEDAVRVIYDHLLSIRKVDKIDLFLYSHGGDVSVPWRIVSMIREFCEEFKVIVPYKANSAATLICLGADNIIMGKKAELGPIDPTLVRGQGSTDLPPEQISVEDINSYITFLKNKAGIGDQAAISQNIAILTDKIGPEVLGQIHRMDHHIKLVARKMLTSQNKKMEEEKINSIIEVLTEKIYSHGHAIGRKEAKEMGLPVEIPNEEEEKLIWRLYLIYENFLQKNQPSSPEIELNKSDIKTIKDVPIAIIQSLNKIHIFKGDLEIRRERNIPSNPEINVNLNLTIPNEVITAISEENIEKIENFRNEIIEELNKIIPQIVYQNMVIQSPEVGFIFKFFNGGWKENE